MLIEGVSFDQRAFANWKKHGIDSLCGETARSRTYHAVLSRRLVAPEPRAKAKAEVKPDLPRPQLVQGESLPDAEESIH